MRAVLAGEMVREGVFRRREVMKGGREEWKAFNMFIVRGTPLKQIAFRETSRINSAVRRAWAEGWDWEEAGVGLDEGDEWEEEEGEEGSRLEAKE